MGSLAGELELLTRYSGKTWGGTGSVPDCHEVPMVPLDTFMRLHTKSNGMPVLLDYAFALCHLGTWPFISTMDLNILLEACLADDNLADNENPPEDPANSESDTYTWSGKKQCKRKGKSKTRNRSKSARATSSASETSLGHKTRLPRLMCHWPNRQFKTYTSLLMALILRTWRRPTMTLQLLEIPNSRWTRSGQNPELSLREC